MSEKIPTFKDLKTRVERMRGTFTVYMSDGWMYLNVPDPLDERGPSNSCSGASIAAVSAFLDALEREWEAR